jgi:polyhydroxyalkanoate synthesis regulator phasin
VLTGLIRAGGERLSTLRRALASPLDLARHVDEEIEERLQALISRGELAAEEGRRLRDQLLRQENAPLEPTLSAEKLKRYLEDKGVPTQEDLQVILEQLEVLAAKLEQVVPDQEPD